MVGGVADLIIGLDTHCHECGIRLEGAKSLRSIQLSVFREREVLEPIVRSSHEHIVEHRQILDQGRELLIGLTIEHLHCLKICRGRVKAVRNGYTPNHKEIDLTKL